MSGEPNSDRRAARRRATIDEIVAAAWELSRRNGLGNFSMRDLGAEVGMRAQSLYGYFASKHEIFDAMFHEGNRALVDTLRAVAGHCDAGDDRTTGAGSAHDHDVLDEILTVGRCFFTFCTSDPVRYQLLFQRTIPGFEPSSRSYSVAQEAYDVGVEPLRAIGLTRSEIDLHVAVLAGLVAQQISNEPGGDRWEQLVDRALTMSIHALAPDLAGDAHHNAHHNAQQKTSTTRSSG
jgi:AcrR family transcriptional regulator